MASKDQITDIFLACRKQLARVVSRFVPPHDIEDIVQETYIRACQFSAREEVNSHAALMTRIARNLAIDQVRMSQSRPTSSFEDATDTQLAALHHLEDEPFELAASKEEFAFFCEAVRELPRQCRRVFILKKVYGYSQKEIAHAMQLSENTVEKHISLGIKRCTLYMRQLYNLGEKP